MRHVCCPAQDIRVVEEEKNINENGDIEYDGESDSTEVFLCEH